MKPDAPSPKMNAVSAQYLTTTTVFVAAGAAPERLLRADARRYYVRFDAWGGIGFNSVVFPGPPTKTGAPGGGVTFPFEWKWRDCPSLVIGEFWAYTTAGANTLITQVFYVGDL